MLPTPHTSHRLVIIHCQHLQEEFRQRHLAAQAGPVNARFSSSICDHWGCRRARWFAAGLWRRILWRVRWSAP